MTDYHSDFEFVSKSMLTTFLRSRVEYYHTYVTRKMAPKSVGKPAFIGQVLHEIFSGEELDDIVHCYPSSVLKCNGDLDGKKAARLRAEEPAFYVKESEYAAIRATVDGVMANDELATLLTAKGKRETRVDAVIAGVQCKCKPDLLCDLGDRLVCYDFKFMEDITPPQWRRSSRRFLYWLQNAHYSAVLESTFKKPVQFRFACIETQFPYRFLWRYYDQVSRERCREKHLAILGDLSVCVEDDTWQDNWESVCVVEPWDLSDNDDELVEVEQ